jgi:hypothetical protein
MLRDTFFFLIMLIRGASIEIVFSKLTEFHYLVLCLQEFYKGFSKARGITEQLTSWIKNQISKSLPALPKPCPEDSAAPIKIAEYGREMIEKS